MTDCYPFSQAIGGFQPIPEIAITNALVDKTKESN
jgi:hypothetical protein